MVRSVIERKLRSGGIEKKESMLRGRDSYLG